MAAINYVFSQTSSSESTTSTSFTTVQTIAGTNFENGVEYLTFICLGIMGAQINDTYSTRFLKGVTEITKSEASNEVSNSAGGGTTYIFPFRFTADGDDINIQAKTDNASNSCQLKMITLLALPMNELIENTDFYIDEDNTSVSISTSWNQGASITFTPEEDDDYVVIAFGRINDPPLSNSIGFRINQSGGASSTDPSALKEGEFSGEFMPFSAVNTYSLTGSTEYTFTAEVQVDAGSTTAVMDRSVVVAIRKGAFIDASHITDANQTISSSTAWNDNLASLDVTPTSSSDFIIFSHTTIEITNGFNNTSSFARIEIDGTDETGLQTTDAREISRGFDPTDELTQNMIMVSNNKSSIFTVDMVGHRSGGTSVLSTDNHLSVFSNQLSAAEQRDTLFLFT